MKVLLIGSGGREHALAYKISESPKLKKLYILPGNPGTSTLGENVSFPFSNHDKVVNFCKEKGIDLIVIGPEQPLVDGLADSLRINGFNVFGPGISAAEIEGDKVFAKNLMRKYDIPTAEYKVFNNKQFSEAIEYLKISNYPIVIKASGLAAGKGVVIAANFDEAKSAVEDCFIHNTFGDAGKEIVVEEFLQGEEASIFIVTDGENFVSLPASQDHKKVNDKDEGKNTGGMGAYAPAPLITEPLMDYILKKIARPTLKAMQSEGKKFTGCLYIGLAITKAGPKVIEYNCRFGDPETQVVLPLLEGDFLELLNSAASGKLNKTAVKYNGGSSVCVVAASGGYPGNYEKGFEIKGLEEIQLDQNVNVFHAGTKRIEDKIVTNGGRVLGVTSFIKKNDVREAKTICYDALSKVTFNGMHYRKDISDKAIK